MSQQEEEARFAQMAEDLVRNVCPDIETLLLKQFPFLRPYLEDILALALYLAWKGRKSYDPDQGELCAWFYRIARNAAISWHRQGWYKSAARERSLVAENEDGETVNFLETVAYDRGAAETRLSAVAEAKLHEGVAQLTPDQRAALLACAEGGNWAKGLAEQEGKPPGTWRQRGRRAIERMKKFLGQAFPGWPVGQGRSYEGGR